jgi:hypothetical protein
MNNTGIPTIEGRDVEPRSTPTKKKTVQDKRASAPAGNPPRTPTKNRLYVGRSCYMGAGVLPLVLGVLSIQNWYESE